MGESGQAVGVKVSGTVLRGVEKVAQRGGLEAASHYQGRGSVWVGSRSSAGAALGAEAEQSNSRGLGGQAKEATVGRGSWHCLSGLVGCSQDTGFHSG